MVYVVSAVLASLSGVILVLGQGQGKADLATGYELDIIASAVIGGASLSGGRGSVVGAVLGTLIFGVLRNALPQIPGATFYDRLIVGVVVVVIVVVDQLLVREKRSTGLKADYSHIRASMRAVRGKKRVEQAVPITQNAAQALRHRRRWDPPPADQRNAAVGRRQLRTGHQPSTRFAGLRNRFLERTARIDFSRSQMMRGQPSKRYHHAKWIGV